MTLSAALATPGPLRKRQPDLIGRAYAKAWSQERAELSDALRVAQERELLGLDHKSAHGRAVTR